MFKANYIGGKPVLTRAGGEKIASIKELIVSPDRTRIVGLLLDGGGLLTEDRVVPIDQLLSAGEDAVIITDHSAIYPVSRYGEAVESMKVKDKLVGKRAVTDQGEAQGKITDVVFEEQTGNIAGFDLSGIRYGDAEYGPVFLPVNEVISIGPDAMIIQAGAVPRLLGLPANAIAPAGEGVSGMYVPAGGDNQFMPAPVASGEPVSAPVTTESPAQGGYDSPTTPSRVRVITEPQESPHSTSEM